MHVACHRTRVWVHIHRKHPPSTDVFPDILIFCRRALAAFGITHHDDQNPKLSPTSSTCQSTEQTIFRKATELLSLRATPSLFQSENRSQYMTQKNIQTAAAKRLPPRKRENPQNSQYSKPTLKTETRKKIEKRAKMKEKIETRRQQMKYYFCAVIGVR